MSLLEAAKAGGARGVVGLASRVPTTTQQRIQQLHAVFWSRVFGRAINCGVGYSSQQIERPLTFLERPLVRGFGQVFFLNKKIEKRQL